jgi:hypothetical protein
MRTSAFSTSDGALLSADLSLPPATVGTIVTNS